jgi:tRNA(Ile)-lysidine synthase
MHRTASQVDEPAERPGGAHAFAVAVSGGRDSVALLHAALAGARTLGLHVHALHVHHGLVPQADAWLEHVQRVCERWAAGGAPLGLQHRALSGKPSRGESVEAWARRERYAALWKMAREIDVTLVLLAHHRRDQAETFLLQALRGAGPAGLAAMPRRVAHDGVVFARPWLDMPRTAIDAYVRRHRLTFVDDPSNADPRFARSRLRASVWPALESAFPDAEKALVAAARQAAEARAALEELAALDVGALCDDAQALRIDAWQALSPARRALALRAWLRKRTGRGAAETLVARLLDELPRRGPARWPAGEGVEVRRYRGRLDLAATAATPTASGVTALHVVRPGAYDVPSWHGTLHVMLVPHGGIALERLHGCELRARSGAETFQSAPNRPPRSLKKQFQAAAVAPWQRAAPLLYCDGALVYVPGLGIDARAAAREGQPRVALQWVPAQQAR